MDIFRKMSFADSTGDAIPYFHNGEYHIFSLTSPPGTTVYPARLRTTWSHSVSSDLIHWTELPTALYPGEGDEPDASGVWTGSVIYGEGQWHAFYTGYCLTAEYQQTICHATSKDGITWTKDAANPVIKPKTDEYEKLDWRDPYVFYNDEDHCYWILISARILSQPVTRRGCIVLYRSDDLVNWKYYGPIYTPGHTNCPECSEMYRIGNTWYLSYSRFSEWVSTIYRVSKSPFGPWRKPKKDNIGGRRFYAAKSMQNDEGRRFYFAWAHDRADQSDHGEWYWGGTFCIPHEVVQDMNGELNIRMPREYVEALSREKLEWNYLPVMGEERTSHYGQSTIQMNSVSTCTYGFLIPEKKNKQFLFSCSATPYETNDYFGILLKSDKEASGCLLLEFDSAMQRVSLINLPMDTDPFWRQSCQAVPPATDPGPDGVRVAEKTFAISPGKAIDIKILIDHDMVEAFIGNEVAFTYRIYAKPEYEVGLITQDGVVEFDNISMTR
ncbi:MAG: GH32 C-terminal domain-containing protein [Lachnospiraceae bacterium]|jgi:beta-fructofuranosidase|nr:GH32 C-terminal domain-containing protein [Lachnospiraceae bacterium]